LLLFINRMKENDARLFRVAPGQVNLTIAAALRQWLPGKSWSDVRRLLSSRHVTVSGNLCLDEGRRLKEEEVVKLLAHPAAAPPQEEDVRIRFLDAHLVVVEKPAGMTTLRHPEERNWPRRRKQLQPTLDEMLPRVIEKKERGARRHEKTSRGGMHQPKKRHQHRREMRKGPPKRLRAVHRSDREPPGPMLSARTVDAERIRGAQFRAHSLPPAYIAVPFGDGDESAFEPSLVRAK